VATTTTSVLPGCCAESDDSRPQPGWRVTRGRRISWLHRICTDLNFPAVNFSLEHWQRLPSYDDDDDGDNDEDDEDHNSGTKPHRSHRELANFSSYAEPRHAHRVRGPTRRLPSVKQTSSDYVEGQRMSAVTRHRRYCREMNKLTEKNSQMVPGSSKVIESVVSAQRPDVKNIDNNLQDMNDKNMKT